MLGAASLRSVLKDVRVSALRCPHHLDDLRFLLSLRRSNDFGAVYRMAASTHAPNPYSAPKSTSVREIPRGPEVNTGNGGGNKSLSMANTFASDASDEAASPLHLGMLIDSHALYLESISDAMKALRRRSRRRRSATPHQRANAMVQSNADEPGEGTQQDKDSVEKTEPSEKHIEDAGVHASDRVQKEAAGIVNVKGDSDPNVEATQQYFWLKKRLAPLSIAPLPSAAASTFTLGEGDDGNGTALSPSSSCSSSSQTNNRTASVGHGSKKFLSGSKVVHPSTGVVYNIPYSACEMGLATDIIHRQSVDAFPFAREFFFSSENDAETNHREGHGKKSNGRRRGREDEEEEENTENTPSLAISDEGKRSDVENFQEEDVDSPLFNAYDYIVSEKHLQTHTVAGANAADEFLFSVHTCAVEPYYKPPLQDLLAVGTEDEVDIVETTLPRYEVTINFILSGRHTHQSKIAIVNTQFFVLECNQPSSPLSPASVALVEHVGLLDARSLLALPAPQPTSSSSLSTTAAEGGAKTKAKGFADRQRVGAVQQHTLSLRLATAEGPGCVGALKGRIFFKIGGIDEDLREAPIRCVEFGPVALREDDHV